MMLDNTTSPPPSLGWHSPYSPKTFTRELRHLNVGEDENNNTFRISTSVAQVEAYSPGEDRIYVNEVDNLFAVFDGHGGDICSRYVVDKLPKQLLSCLQHRKPTNENDYKHILKTSFVHVDEQFLSEHKHIVKTSPAGSCGVTVLIRDNKLYICNVGDSRVLLCSKNNNNVNNDDNNNGKKEEKEEKDEWIFKLLTNDHNTKNERERQMVKARTTDPLPLRTGVTSTTEGDRIGGILMVTRAFGDGIFKRRDMSLHPLIHHLPYITSEPEITIHDLTPSDQFVIISSDGLYEVLSPSDVANFVVKLVESGVDPSTIAHEVLELMFAKLGRLLKKTPEQVKSLPVRKNFMDDTSIIILFFSSTLSASSSPSLSPMALSFSPPSSPSHVLSAQRSLYHFPPQN